MDVERGMKRLIVAALAVCAFAQDREAALGEHVAAVIRKESFPADGESWDYVYRIGRRVSPDRRLQTELRFGEFGGPGLSPLWVPGYVFVPARLLMSVGSEAELAGTIARAIAYSGERGPGPISLIGGNRFDRATTLRVDQRALSTMADAGYDPRALIEYIARTAPADRERIDALEAALADIPPRTEWIENTAEFGRAQERVRRMLVRVPMRRPSLYRRDR